MSIRSLSVLTLLTLMPVPVWGQNALSGQWETKPAISANIQSGGVRRGATFSGPSDSSTSGSRSGDAAPAASRVPPVKLNLSVKGDRVTGTVVETNRQGVLTIEDGSLTNNTFTFKTRRAVSKSTEIVLWKGEIVNGETIFLVRTLFRPERNNASSTGPGLPGEGGVTLPDDVKRAGGALVLRRK